MTNSSDGGDGNDDDLKEGQGDNSVVPDDRDPAWGNKSGTYRVIRAQDGEYILCAEEDRLVEKLLRYQDIYNRRASVRNDLRSLFERNGWLAAQRGGLSIPEMSPQEVSDEDRRMYRILRGKTDDRGTASPLSREYVEDIVMYYEEYSKYMGEKLTHFVGLGNYDQVESLLRDARETLKKLPLYPDKALAFFEDAVRAKIVGVLPKLAGSNPLLYLKLRDGLAVDTSVEDDQGEMLKSEPVLKSGSKPESKYAREFLVHCLQKSVALYVEMAAVLDEHWLVDAREIHQSKYVQGFLQRHLVKAMRQSPDWYVSMRGWLGGLGIIDPQAMDKDPEIIDASVSHFHYWKNRSPITYVKLRDRWVAKGLWEPTDVRDMRVQYTTLIEKLFVWSLGVSSKDIDLSSSCDREYSKLFLEHLEYENAMVVQLKSDLDEQVKRFFQLFPQFHVEKKHE